MLGSESTWQYIKHNPDYLVIVPSHNYALTSSIAAILSTFQHSILHHTIRKTTELEVILF